MLEKKEYKSLVQDCNSELASRKKTLGAPSSGSTNAGQMTLFSSSK